MFFSKLLVIFLTDSCLNSMASCANTAAVKQTAGIQSYYHAKIEELEAVYRERTQNLRRLEAQRNELNSKVRLLREELQLLQEPGSYVGEVVKAMGKTKVLVKV
jgi:26S proteasome regulatory subunit T6